MKAYTLYYHYEKSLFYEIEFALAYYDQNEQENNQTFALCFTEI